MITAGRVLVTGGAGFLGSHLCKKLVREGRVVTCLDNLSSGARSNVADLELEPQFTFLHHDVITPIETEASLIFNLACPASPPHYQRDPVSTFKTCVLGAMNLLQLANSCGARILQASTSEVYGDPHVHPQPETYWGNVNPIGARSCYDEGKRSAETLFFDYHRQYGTDVAVMRIFNTYGPRMRPDDGRVVSNFIVQALRGEDITIFGDGSQTRSFCYVDDLIDGMVRLMAADLSGPINIGNPTEFSMLELAELVLLQVGGPSRLKFCPLPADDPKQRRPDISIAKRDLGWSPTVSLEDGLRETISYFRATL